MAFGFFKKLGTDALNQYSGNKDFLEAVCAASAMVAAADGSVSDDEVGSAVDSATGNPVLSKVYSTSEIETCMDTQLKRAKTASGRVGLLRELEDVAKKPQQLREDVFLAALDVASSDGNVSPQEDSVLNRIATTLGVDRKRLSA